MAAPTGRWSVVYHDHSANKYSIKSVGDGAAFEYAPITPERSSTGTYSGGDPRAGRLDQAQTTELWRQIRAFESTASLHTQARAKGTGVFAITDEASTRSFIITRGPELLAFDAFLKAL